MSKSELKRLAAQMSDKDRADRLAARCASQMDKIAEQDARIKELEGALRVIVPYWTHEIGRAHV